MIGLSLTMGISLTSKAVLENDGLGVDLVVNGGFDTDTDWTLSGAVISGGVVTIAGTNGFISQMLDVSNGDFVKLVYTITSTSAAGNLFLSSTGFGDIIQGLTKTVGTHAIVILVLDDAAPLLILHNTDDAISVDDVSVKRII